MLSEESRGLKVYSQILVIGDGVGAVAVEDFGEVAGAGHRTI